MYDKILRHRHTIEAHLASAEELGSSGRDLNSRTRLLDFEHNNQIRVTVDNEDHLEKANRIISSIIQPSEVNSQQDDILGLTGLTKMATKMPLGSAASWDATTRPRNMDEAMRQLLEASALPREIGLLQQQQPPQPLWPLSHSQVSRAVSDSYVQSKAVGDLTRLKIDPNSRRKLESEDSSYGSDLEHEHRRPLVTNVNSHEDVSRTVSETLGAEYSEYVDHYESVEAIVRDKSYEAILCFALKLGYTEAQLQKALSKLGKKAREDQILEELIRIQRSSKICNVSNPEESSSTTPENSETKRLKSAAEYKETIPINSLNDLQISSSNGEGEEDLLPIIIDGSNVAMSHGNKERFSCRGIRICVDWFRSRGHKEITVFVPLWRKETSKPETPTTDQHILTELEKEQFLTFTPSRQVQGRRYVCHDDKYILNLAADNGGIVVSNDNFRELINDKPKFKEVIEERILMYSFIKDRFMPPDDPFGKNGPTLDQFLRKKVKLPSQLPPPCPYGKKCTYGNKCKYYHPDRATNQKSITDKLKEQTSQRINEVRARVNSRDSSPGDPLTRTRSMQPKQDVVRGKQAVTRTKSSAPRLSNNWPLFDTSLPPPAPRAPWIETVAPGSNQGPQNTHAKLSRQYSVNPNYDPRIHNLPPKPDFSYPPPPFQPPSHLAVTRNASEPDPSFLLPPQIQQPPQQVMMAEPEHHLHKTWSSPNMEQKQNAVSPIFGLTANNVWESLRPHEDVRSKIYYNLAQLFPEDTVRCAMASLPHETDPKVICKHIFLMEAGNAGGGGQPPTTQNSLNSGVEQLPR